MPRQFSLALVLLTLCMQLAALADDRSQATSDDGNTFIYQADPSGFELLGKNKLADQVAATPTICGSRIYMRAATLDGNTRQEFLYCLE